MGNCSKAQLLFIILYVHLPWFPLTNYYQQWGQHTYHYSFRIIDKIKSIFLSHLKVVFVQIGTQTMHTHLESSKTVQIFAYSSILLTGLEFTSNCTVRDFACPWHSLLIDVNVILELHTKVCTNICKIFSTHVSFLFNKHDSSTPAIHGPNLERELFENYLSSFAPICAICGFKPVIHVLKNLSMSI